MQDQLFRANADQPERVDIVRSRYDNWNAVQRPNFWFPEEGGPSTVDEHTVGDLHPLGP